ncbi:MAG: class I adenylate-forming enzyme family protein [Spirochaetota bacterium]|nr:class I adenylate-forming enzyme family protein [Spirochaetota bacterium]
MSKKSYGKLLSNMVRYNPNGIVVTYGDRNITWKELDERVNRLGNALRELGIAKGDHAIIMFHDCPEFFEANYALQKIGAIPIPMNFKFVAREIEYQVEKSDSILFIFEDQYMEVVEEALPRLGSIKNFICIKRGETKISDNFLEYEEMISKHPSTDPSVEVFGDDICTISFTGGTTGMPKGVVLTYDNFWKMAEFMFSDLLARLIADPRVDFKRMSGEPKSLIGKLLLKVMSLTIVRSMIGKMISSTMPKTFGTPIAPLLQRLTGGHSAFTNMPLFHMANYVMLIVGPITGSPPRCILRSMASFDPKEALEIIERERPHMVGFVPTQWKMVLDYPEFGKYDTTSVKMAMTGAGINPAKLKRRILESFPHSIIIDGFGQTEMTPVTSMRIDSSVDGLKDRAVGTPLTGVNVQIINENGEKAAPGEVGEICYQSDTVMREYYKDSEGTAKVMEGGWFHSGDLGYFDEDGDLMIVDRKKETISTGGEKVYPHEVEEILQSHPKVLHSCVIGVPDETWGKAVRAVVELVEGEKMNESELIDWCRDKMTGFKKPKTVVFVDNIPLNPVGKIRRADVKEKYGM